MNTSTTTTRTHAWKRRLLALTKDAKRIGVEIVMEEVPHAWCALLRRDGALLGITWASDGGESAVVVGECAQLMRGSKTGMARARNRCLDLLAIETTRLVALHAMWSAS